MKQTAVEWYAEEYAKYKEAPWKYVKTGGKESILEKAKEMDKEQSIDFARVCLNKAKDLDVLTAFINAQQYYNETYGK